jgi:hypothetical protein
MSYFCIFPDHSKRQIWSKHYLFCTQLRETISINLEVNSEKSQEKPPRKNKKDICICSLSYNYNGWLLRIFMTMIGYNKA